MSVSPQPATPAFELAPGLVALPPGLLWIASTRTLVAADVHFGYEDVVGGSLPLWSTTELVATLTIAVEAAQARELVFLGDVIHGSRMSEGAALAVGEALAHLRARLDVVLIAGNHEGRTRGSAVLGTALEACERGGWLSRMATARSRVRARSSDTCILACTWAAAAARRPSWRGHNSWWCRR